LVAAQEDYADYPGLEEQLEIARDGIAALEATKLTNQMTEADRLRRKDDYAGAIALLKEARAAAITAVPHPKPGSPLQERLDDLARLIDDIVAAEERYNRMLEQLDAVARLMDDYERDKTPQSLQKARGMMATLSEDEQKHPKTLEQLVRLSQLQTVDENWEQGLSAYRRGQWDNAIKLLERVAKAEAQQSQEAGKLVKRANAAGDVLSAQQAEEEGRYADALNIYKDAEETFTQQESDLRTAEFDAKARDGRARMELKTTNDAEARRVLTDAERRLTAANKRAADRRGVGDKVQPIADFATIVDQLAVALALDSTLKNEIEARWSLARQSWLVAYRAGLQAAIGSDDMTTLERAKALGRELEQNDLLIEPDDKRLYRQVEEKWLDAQAKQLRRATNVNWAAIEANRQRRIEIGGEIPEIMREYAEAAESRVLSEMEQLSNQRRRREGDELNYLRQQLDTNPALLHNSRLVEEFMGMLWRDKRWVEAEKRAAKLAHRRLENARVLSRVWLGLTKAAKYLKERDEKTFNAEMSRLEDYLTDNAEAGLRPLYDRQRRALIEDAVGKLVEEAQSRTRQGSEPDIVAATSLYALANRIDPDDAQVAADLEGLRPQLHSIIANRLLDAKALVATVPLKQTIQEGKSLLGLLRNIDQVADVAGLPHGVREELTAGIADLEAKLNGWDEVWKQLDRVDVEIQRAKTEPYPFEGSSGGWDFQSANRQWSNTQQSAQNRGLGGDLAVQAELQTRKREIEALGRLGSELNNHVKALLNALDNEEFEPARPDNPDDPSPRAGWPAEAQPNGSSYGIDNAATLLDGAWSGALARGFAGLEKALYREGHPTNIPLHATADYQRAAQRQRDNFDQWRAWARRVNDDHEQLERAAKLLKRDLDALRLDATLDNLLEQCQEILRLCEQFTVNAAGRPRTIPLSRKAATQKNSVNLAWQDEVETADSGLRHKAQALLEAIEKDKAKLPPLLDSLDNVMRNLRTNSQPTIRGVLIKRENPPDATVVRRWLKRAREQLKACLDVDPQHLKVQEAKKEIEAIENRFATSKSPARE
ncbi:hypothetical protein, partial [Promineifilum sp.]|uniref:hypothetical protein n=1 Tax=Promineifilum sp. TaxID=2664178 RepID=UPI0035B0593E